MTNRHSKWIAGALAAAMVTTLALAAEPTLKIGDSAPKLQTGKWAQGEPVKDFKEGKAYIVEFWATWCGPCRVSIPHLNETAKKYKDKGLIVIGQDCWEQDEEKVAPFVKTMGDKMTYCVALDDKDGSEKGKMAETWMAAAGRNGIPSAFLVDTTGKIAWIGHPMQLKDGVIEEVLAGKFDVQKAAQDYDKQKKTEAKVNAAWTEVSQAMRQKKWDEATTKLADVEKLLPEDERDGLDMMRFNIQIGKKDYPAAYKLAEKYSNANKDNAMAQNDLAWRIVTDPDIEQRDLDLAETIANRANAAAKGKDAGILDTLARVKFMQGKKEDAIALQEKAVKLAESNQQESLQKSLDSYKKGELPKED